MQWIKNNLVCLIIILVLLGLGIFGVCFAGQRDAEAQSLIQKLAESNRRATEYIAKQQSDISKLESSLEQLRRNNIELERNNRKLIESEKRRQANDLEALRIIESAAHR
jgi:uncharacterized protein HemX